jgi:hypothetical protein
MGVTSEACCLRRPTPERASASRCLGAWRLGGLPAVPRRDATERRAAEEGCERGGGHVPEDQDRRGRRADHGCSREYPQAAGCQADDDGAGAGPGAGARARAGSAAGAGVL